MALLQGTGSFILNGSSARIHDVQMAETATLVLDGEVQHARGLILGFNNPLQVLEDYINVYDSTLSTVDWQGAHGVYGSNYANTLVAVTGDYFRCHDNLFDRRQGLDLTANQAVVVGNIFANQGQQAATNAHDGVTINGDRNLVEANRFIPFNPITPVTRSAVNIASGDCNMIVGNDVGDPADYATDAIIDAGTDTWLVYPNDPTYGDNFTDCTPTSPSSP
jgi:hypothetical protein